MPEFEQLQEDISTLPETAQMLVVDFVALLKKRYASTQPSNQPLDLEAEPFVGMWQDNVETRDSTAWVRDVRQKHWRS